MKLVFVLTVLSSAAFAQGRYTTSFDHQPIPPSQCGLSWKSCYNSDGNSKGMLNACQVTCYHGQNAVCVPGSFTGEQNHACDVDTDNSCYCE